MNRKETINNHKFIKNILLYLKKLQTRNKHNILFVSGITYPNQRTILEDKTTCIATDIGKQRNNNEDAALSFNHPNNNNFKLLALADGIGGKESGEIFSHTILLKLQNWFENIPYNYYNNAELLKAELLVKIYEINDYLQNNNFPNGGTTLSIAIICKNEIITLNIGDSRIYSFNSNSKLELLTEDEILIWTGKENIDDIRFHISNNTLTNSVPTTSGCLSINECQIIGKNDIEYLILCSDGLSDMLSTQQMQNIIKTNNEDIQNIASTLVNYAVSNDAYPDKELNAFYRSMLKAGKDNTTCIVANIKKRKIKRP